METPSGKPKTDPLMQLPEAVLQLTGWACSDEPEAPANQLYWAQLVHHLSALVLSKSQDRHDGNSYS